jgi:ATP-dependent RNA helicase DDX56/DBP9
MEQNYRRHKPTTFPGSEHDEEVLKKIEKHQKEGQKLEDWKFDMKRLEPFRYRFADALRAVTKIAIREARIKELRNELLKSQKLSRYVSNYIVSGLNHADFYTSVRREPHSACCTPT